MTEETGASVATEQAPAASPREAVERAMATVSANQPEPKQETTPEKVETVAEGGRDRAEREAAESKQSLRDILDHRLSEASADHQTWTGFDNSDAEIQRLSDLSAYSSWGAGRKASEVFGDFVNLHWQLHANRDNLGALRAITDPIINGFMRDGPFYEAQQARDLTPLEKAERRVVNREEWAAIIKQHGADTPGLIKKLTSVMEMAVKDPLAAQAQILQMYASPEAMNPPSPAEYQLRSQYEQGLDRVIAAGKLPSDDATLNAIADEITSMTRAGQRTGDVGTDIQRAYSAVKQRLDQDQRSSAIKEKARKSVIGTGGRSDSSISSRSARESLDRAFRAAGL